MNLQKRGLSRDLDWVVQTGRVQIFQPNKRNIQNDLYSNLSSFKRDSGILTNWMINYQGTNDRQTDIIIIEKSSPKISAVYLE